MDGLRLYRLAALTFLPAFFDFLLETYGIFAAGLTVGVRINRMSTGSVIDESLPLIQAVRKVSHIQTPNNYRCAASVGIPEC